MTRDDFAVVDAGRADHLVAMMQATDAWPEVGNLREWVLDLTGPGAGDRVLDVGCGPGTFGALAAARGATPIDVDVSAGMLASLRAARPDARAARAEVEALPVRTGSGALERAERVLQWLDDPRAALAELWRATAPDGALAVTDTDWGRFTIEHLDPEAALRITSAAGQWVRHPRLAADLLDVLRGLGGSEVRSRTDVVVIDAWDATDHAQHDGPAGLPLERDRREPSRIRGRVSRHRPRRPRRPRGWAPRVSRHHHPRHRGRPALTPG